MAFLLDTCVVSELTKHHPEPNVTEWFSRQTPESLFLSSITTGEIRRGIERLPISRRRNSIESWFWSLKDEYISRIVSFDMVASEIWGRLKADSEKLGMRKSDTDLQIAAIAIQHGHVLATRNIKDFRDTGVNIIDPWTFGS
ncbi:MAG: type II toxin-antitoxin system VapC family toxin [Acidobacteria bacterium]|nr:type II toxin-antitoxin system VapC family toxin [Acidobacteriota bacterium]